MSKAVAAGISLWLEPEGASLERFKALIKNLARDLGTPAFEPHVTLLGALMQSESDVLERTIELSTRLSPIEVRLTRAGVGSHYFHFLFFEAALSRELIDAHAKARRAFDLDEDEDEYAPHLSLAYAIPAEHEPESLLRRVPGRPWGRFRAESITVARTVGGPDEWEVLARLPLKG